MGRNREPLNWSVKKPPRDLIPSEKTHLLLDKVTAVSPDFDTPKGKTQKTPHNTNFVPLR